MASIEITIRTDDETTMLIRRPYEVSTDTHIFHGTGEKKSNFHEVFDQVVQEVRELMTP